MRSNRVQRMVRFLYKQVVFHFYVSESEGETRDHSKQQFEGLSVPRMSGLSGPPVTRDVD